MYKRNRIFKTPNADHKISARQWKGIVNPSIYVFINLNLFPSTVLYIQIKYMLPREYFKMIAENLDGLHF
jgi:hypothetical protein